ncbi:GntR family transcriptional regulator [Bailinhaonella thermotolerans]|uniref:GntR family transcriptional regulator n=1 Tax=Bailinhaonella thermotolerans TaxID=1070861 RepID=A0A3A4AUM2_9ACTN|nr:GntR family transcriptional regulator [Bailinhaonella thermotolerans]
MPAGLKRDRVRDFLLDLIADKKAGEAIPSERALCKELGVSRPTLRAAIDDLVRSGMLVREHGRGTFTGPRRVVQALRGTGTNAFYTPPAEGHWLSRVLEFGVIPAGAPLSARLQISPPDPVVRIVRLRLVDDEPMSIERLHLPHALIPGLEPADLESGVFYRVLRERFGVDVSGAVQTIEATVTDETEAGLLHVPQHAPALLVERTTRDTLDRVVEFTRSIYRGDRYRVTSELHFDAASG